MHEAVKYTANAQHAHNNRRPSSYLMAVLVISACCAYKEELGCRSYKEMVWRVDMSTLARRCLTWCIHVQIHVYIIIYACTLHYYITIHQHTLHVITNILYIYILLYLQSWYFYENLCATTTDLGEHINCVHYTMF